MNIRYIITLGTILFLILHTCDGQSFVNLNFELANVSGYSVGSTVPVTNAFPGWAASYTSTVIGTPVEVSNVWYDGLSLGGAVISINDTNTPFAPSFRPIDGRYSAFLFGGGPPSVGGPLNLFYSATLSQTGLVPNGTASLLVKAEFALNNTAFIVSVNGQTISMLSQGDSYRGDISSFAGQTVTLSLTEPAPPVGVPPSLVILDDIRFSTNPVPEPSTWSLMVIFILFRCLRIIGFNKSPEPLTAVGAERSANFAGTNPLPA
jgi:hypothetical protein